MELLAVRPDLFDPAGLARAMRGFLGMEEGAPAYRVETGEWEVEARHVSVRPRIVVGIVRGLSLDDARLRSLMKLQENVHWALGRDRKLASIGVYDLARIAGPRLVYRGTGLDEAGFVPLGFDRGDAGDEWTPRRILADHPKGRSFARLIAGADEAPLLCDSGGGVLSMPPIINSEATRVTTRTRDVLVDVTGLEDRHIERALNIVVTSLLESCPGSRVETCVVKYEDGSERRTPDLAPHSFELDPDGVSRLIGVRWDSTELASLLRKMRHDAAADGGGTVEVRVPAWRADVLHARDLMEDAAIAWGYDRMPEATRGSATRARASTEELVAGQARAVMAGLGCLEVMTLTLSSEEASFDRAGLPDEGAQVRLANPISVEQTMLRVSLLPGLLETLAINLNQPYPQRIFEVGRVSEVLAGAETGAAERHHAAFAFAGDGLGYADVRSAVDVLLTETSGESPSTYCFEPSRDRLFLPGRGATIRRGGRMVGRVGEVSPEVLERYRIIHPVAVAEVDIAALSPQLHGG
jgi:phenylalanyl-tRNA synthetase beta chain